MSNDKFFSPLKIGLFTVVLAYFLFALHQTFTLSWIGEWNRYTGSLRFEIYFEDVVGFVGITFRLTAGIIAFSAIVSYFLRKRFSKAAMFRILRLILVLEAIFWMLSFLPTAYFEVRDLFFGGALHDSSVSFVLRTFTLNALPVLVQSIALPAVLLTLVYKLNPKKTLNGAIRWALIAGTLYIVFYWLLTTTIWIQTVQVKGMTYLTSYPQNLLSVVLSAFGLLALGFYSGAVTIKYRNAQTLNQVDLRRVGAIIFFFGMYFLWNYLTWIYFGGWSSWYALFLGHNEDLWVLSLPLLGIPMLFIGPSTETTGESQPQTL